MQYYIHYLDIVSLTRFDTSLCNKKLRSYFINECKKYINFDTYTTSEYYQYVYLRQIKNKNIMIFNNRQLKLFYDNLQIQICECESAHSYSQMQNFITYLSISDCCIDNNLINYILTNFSNLRVLNIGNSKFTNSMLDTKNITKYELTNIYSTLFLDDKFIYKYHNNNENTYMNEYSDYIHKFNKTHFSPIYLDNAISVDAFSIECIHDEYLIESIKLIESIQLIESIKLTKLIESAEPIKYIIPYRDSITNIMNNICGNLFDGEHFLNLEELCICEANNLKYTNIIPILRKSKLKLLKIHIATNEDILEILKYDIPVIELVNEKLKFYTVENAIKKLGKKIVKLEINIKELKTGMKINFGLTTDNGQNIFITFWEPRINLVCLCRIFEYCIDIDELKVSTVYIFMIIRRQNVRFNNLKKIKILNTATVYESATESAYDEIIGEEIYLVI